MKALVSAQRTTYAILLTFNIRKIIHDINIFAR